MPFVEIIPPESAPDELKVIYDDMQKVMGLVPQFFQALGSKPNLIRAIQGLGGSIMPDGALPKTVKEQMAVVVSGINTSSYCVALHLEMLRGMGIEKKLGMKLATNYPAAQVEEKVKVLFRLADKLTKNPESYGEADVDEVLKAGWTREAVLEAVLAASLFNFYNRISIGLGLLPDY